MRKLFLSLHLLRLHKALVGSMVCCVLLGVPLDFTSIVSAQTTVGGPIHVSAVVPAGLMLELTIIDQLTNAEVPSMDFGELVRNGDEFRAARFFKVLLNTNVAGESYQLTQNATPLTRNGGAETIPEGAFIVKPAYVETDNFGLTLPIGSSVGAVASAIGTRPLFSDPTGSSRVLSLTYTLSGDPNTGATEVIALSQKSGSYSGTVQFTLTTA